MDKQDLDLLLQARTSELQHEYENLVRSLDAAYEAVKAIGRDIAENRAEARRLFDTRLKLARGDDLEAVLRLCNGDAVGNAADKSIASHNKANGRKQNELPGMLRLYVQQSDAASRQHANLEISAQPRVVTLTSAENESIARLSPITSIRPDDGTSIHVEQFQQGHKQAQQHQQPQYSPVYVGDDHSYAVNEEESAEHQLMLEERLMLEAAEMKRRRPRENLACGVDLTIVKTESPDNVLEERKPLVDHPKNIVAPVAVTRSQKISGTLSKRATPKSRKILEVNVDDEISRKRKQTRERMRRWRAKRKMEEGAKQAYKYKLVIAKTPNA